MSFHPSEIIRRKRGGESLSEADLSALLSGYLEGVVHDYQMSAFMMAVYFKGMTPEETRIWAKLMWKSGISLPHEDKTDFWIDKHSTGGVGDKTSLLLVPIVHCVCERVLGKNKVRIPMISGRGLDFTGGTLDKLEAVPGFSSNQTIDRAMSLLQKTGYFMMGQTEDLAPADRLLYALRDVTATVESLPLIVSSILSKKLAESLNGIVFDVKFGSGAFMQEKPKARELAQALASIAKEEGLAARAVLTPMNEPLGWKVGHQLEIEECVDFLRKENLEKGLYEVTLTLAAEMVSLASRGKLSLDQAKAECATELGKRPVMDAFAKMFEQQGGDFAAFEKNRVTLAKRPRVALKAPKSGFVGWLDARSVGKFVRSIGGGRKHKTSPIDLNVGVIVHKKVGDKVASGDTILEAVLSDSLPNIDKLMSHIDLRIEATAPPATRWVDEVIDG